MMLSMRGWIALERVEAWRRRATTSRPRSTLGPQVALPAPVLASAAALLALGVAEQGELERAEELLARHDLDGALPSTR